MSAPSFIAESSGVLSFTAPLPAGFRAGDLIISCCRELNGSGATYSVNAPWQLLAQVQATNLTPLNIAYLFVPSSGLVSASCTFTPTGGSNNTNPGSISFLFRNLRISNPIGVTAQNASDSAATASCGAISASNPNSLAVLIGVSGLTFSWPPSGWTSIDTQANNGAVGIASKLLTNAGDSSGAISISNGGTSFFDLINIELQGDAVPVPDKYFGGLPFPGITR